MADKKPFHRRWRRFFLKSAIVLFTTVLCLSLAEFGARILFPQFNPRAPLALQVMPEHFALGPPGVTEWHSSPKGDFSVQIKFNQYGFRDTKDLKDSTGADWFVVGDSFTLGFGVEENKRYSNLLEDRFRADGRSTRVFNFGVPGNFLDYQRLVHYAKSRGATIQHLIIGVCMDNDLEDYRTGESDWQLVKQWNTALSIKDRVRHWLKAHSALYITTSFVMESSPSMRRVLEKVGLANDLVAMDAAQKNKLDETVLRGGCDELVKLAAESPDTLVLIIPSRRLWLANKATESKIHETFVQMCRTAGLRVIDLKPVLEQSADPLGFYFAHDQHWSPRGQAAAAEEL